MREMSTVRRVGMGLVLAVLCTVWTIPTLGLFITSLRPREEATRSGWWTVFSSPGELTLENYRQVLAGADYSYTTRDGRKVTVRGDNMASAFLNSLAVTVPSVIIPIFLAALAAYGFAWLEFPGRKLLFTLIVSLLVVPLQVALIPILRDYQKIGLNGTFLGIWLAHTGFGLPLATYLLFNYISTIPRSIIESSLIDGADHFQIFTRLIVPLSAPALASFAIFQFLWVWNDLLVALVFLSGVGQNMEVLTQRLLNMVGTRGQNWHLLTSGAFVTMLLPVIVFLGLQKYFVRGLMEGSIKG
ncbi:carbohydrate ABC transporter permease [Spirochaeta thermophila]|uniref:Transporter n=1 Tax=Winmispira thermophila (strain ATCC 49972 / DSM 6192 / RI 19.B1) TaxID=665571 RepID=E0RTR7_WINT6|nr:carbohydrate ABC transporter permease [Spirochaeta thermophila]ADN02442.1 transporter [Spirochaeta thermophila DSM 6192]